MTRTATKAIDAAKRVLDVCDILGEITKGGYEQFVADRRTQWAVEMGLIRIGEGVNRIPPEIRDRFPDQPWREMIAMRNFAAHQYDDLDPRRVWQTLTNDVPALRDYLQTTVLPRLCP